MVPVMREGWTETTISDLLEVSIGGVWGSDPGVDEIDVSVYRQTEFDDNGTLSMPSDAIRSITKNQLKSRTLQPGDVLMQKSAGTPTLPGRVVIVPSGIERNATCSNFLHLLRAEPNNCNPHFLFWYLWLNHQSGRAFEFQRGTNIKNLDLNQYLAQAVLLPPIEEQKRIVDVVSSVDAYIDALQQQADTARTAFLSICEEIVLTGENMKPLHEVASVIMGQSPEGSTCNTDGIGTPLLTGPTEFTKRIVGPPRQWTSKETKLSQSGDILFCVRGATAGRINIGNYKSVIGRGLAAIRCDNLEDTNFVRFALQVGLGQLLPAAGGTIFPNISQSQLRNFEVSWPSGNRRAELSGLVRSIEEVVLRTEHAIDDAKNLRSGLLSDLLSGEHEIPESYDVFVGAA